MAAILFFWLCNDSVSGQLAPGAAYVFPPVVRIGETTEVRMGVLDPTDDLQWFVHDERVELEVVGPVSDFFLPPPPYWIGPRALTAAPPIPREVPARLSVAAGAEPGMVCWQIASANGPSRTASVLLSSEREILETRSRDFPQRISELPVAVSGRLSRLTEVDQYELTAERDGPISVTLTARRFGSDFRGILRVQDSTGRQIADFADTTGMDGGLTFFAKAGQTYRVCLNDVDFRGDRAYVYRLAFAARPRVLCTVPAAGQRGTTAEVRFVVDGLHAHAEGPEILTRTVNFPMDETRQTSLVELQTRFGAVPVAIPLSNASERSVERDQPSEKLAIPGAITGMFSEGVDQQHVLFEAAKGDHLTLELQSVSLGGFLDPALQVLGPDGKVAGENDDSSGTTDSLIDLKVAEGGVFTCVIRSMATHSGRGDDNYRLQVRRREADFSLQMPQQVSILSGGQVELAVTATRYGGFDGEISLKVLGLPEGVIVEGDWKIPSGQTEFKGVLRCAGDAAVTASLIRVLGSSLMAEAEVTRFASSRCTGPLCLSAMRDRQLETCLLAMTMNAPIEVLVIDRERQRDVHRGCTYPAELRIVRKNGFAGEVALVMTAQQDRNRQGSRGQTIVVPAGETKALFPCFLPEWLATDITRRIIVHGVAVVPDAKGNLRHLTMPADARITMIMEGALLKLAVDRTEHMAALGAVCEIPFRVSRSMKLPQEVTVELDVPEEIRGLLYAEPVVLHAGIDHGVLRVISVADSRLAGPWGLRVSATAMQDARWPVVSETTVQLEYSESTVAP
ncbi:MAG: hypothetical protein WCK86_02690 [Planctomycetia bacterium]